MKAVAVKYPPLVLVEWIDTTNIATWQDLNEIAAWAPTGGFVCRNVGYPGSPGNRCTRTMSQPWDSKRGMQQEGHDVTVQGAMAPAFPKPYLQPVGSRDCSYYTTAYLARCLGHPDVTAQQVMAWRGKTRRHEDRYIEQELGVETRSWWADVDNDAVRRRWWLGADGADWVREWIEDGWIGYASVHRVDFMTHAVAVLDATEDGVLLMDPVYGHVIEPWDWFLGIGAGTYGCHHISTWHRRNGRSRKTVT